MAGLLASILITRQTCTAGRPQQLAAEYGAMAALPAMALTCLWLRGTRLTPEAIGWVAKPLFGCKPDRLGPACPPIIGRLLIGSVSTMATPTLAASAPRWLTCLELRLLSSCLPWAKIAMPI